MGGTGAAKICASHPERFAGFAGLAGMIADLEIECTKENPLALHIVRHAGGIEKFRGSGEDVWRLLRKNAQRLPPFYYACGDKDHNNEITMKRLPSYVKELGLSAKLEVLEGFGHEWRFWDVSIERALDFFGLEKMSEV
jgi:putative tributyrin esterase